jgi:hypothetical protein
MTRLEGAMPSLPRDPVFVGREATQRRQQLPAILQSYRSGEPLDPRHQGWRAGSGCRGTSIALDGSPAGSGGSGARAGSERRELQRAVAGGSSSIC